MNLRRKSIGSIVALALLGTAAQLQASTSPVDPTRENRTIVLRTSDLRSAYLIRSGHVQYDANNLSPAGLQRQLQRHFDTVVALLMLNQGPSIELALDRLESRQSANWSSEERRAWRERLLTSRRVQLVRLIEYRNRGLFPQNEGQAAGPVPIFVDAHDTACAVGHLMRLSGCEREVDGIQHKNNLVYVPDVTAGPVVAWTLTSGLTLEEAALIQPAYGPQLAPISPEAVEVLTNAQSFSFDKLRFSNFQMFAAEDGVDVPEVNIPTSHSFCDWWSCTPVAIWAPNLLEPVGVFPVAASLSSDGRGAGSEYSRVVVQFDVEVTAPNLRIAQLPFAETLISGYFFHGNQLELFVSGDRAQLWVDYSPEQRLWGPDGPLIPILVPPILANDSFAPTDRMTIVTEMLLRDGQLHQSQFINFELVAVPEPATATVALLAIGMIGATRLRPNRL